MIDPPDPHRIYDSSASFPTDDVSSVMMCRIVIVLDRQIPIYREYTTSSDAMARCIYPLAIETCSHALYRPCYSLNHNRTTSLII